MNETVDNQQENIQPMHLNTNLNQDTVELVLTTTEDSNNTKQSCLDEMVLLVTLDCCIQEELEEGANQNNTIAEQSTADNEYLFDSAHDTNYQNEILMTTTNDDLNIIKKDNLNFPAQDVCLFDHNYANQISVKGKEEICSNQIKDSHKEGTKHFILLQISFLFIFFSSHPF